MKTKLLSLLLFFFSFHSSFSQANKVIEDLNNQLQNYPKQDTNRVILLLKLVTANYGFNPKNM